VSDLASVYAASPVLFTGSVFVIGLLVGSFLNVVMYRLPIMLEREWREQASEILASSADTGAEVAPAAVAPPVTTPPVAAPPPMTPPPFNLVTPRSACPSCKAPIKAWQNIPVVSWLMLRGRCAGCGTRISARYPLVELGTALLSAIVAWHFGFGAAAGCGLLLTWSLIALTGIDIDHQMLPDIITLPLLWTGLLAAAAIGPTAGLALPVSPHDAILGAVAGYSSLWIVYHLFRLVTGKEGMGFGDFKLYAALGAWLGWHVLPLVILLSAATGAVLGIALIAFRGKDRNTQLPFGPYLAAAGWLAMLYGDSLLGVYMRVSGLEHPAP
jgi:leader peptidase (prepilin peptidase)/N-methyltransferase